MPTEIKLKGSYVGVTKIKPMKNPDIIKSKILSKICEINNLTISTKPNNEYFIYHSYYTKDRKWGGRWYCTKFTKNNFKYNDNKMMVTYIIPEWNDTKKKVPIEIYFTEKGYKKLNKIFDN